MVAEAWASCAHDEEDRGEERADFEAALAPLLARLRAAEAALASRTVETAEEWAAEPIGAIVRTAGQSVVTRFDAGTAAVFGDERGHPWYETWALPATVLWTPVPTSPEDVELAAAEV